MISANFFCAFSLNSFFNGDIVKELFCKHLIPTFKCCLALFILRSKNPANVKIAKCEKLNRWCEFKQYI